MTRKENKASEILGKKIEKKKMLLQEAVQDCLDHGEPLSNSSVVSKNRKLSLLLTERSKELSGEQDYPAKVENLHFEIDQILPVLQTMFPQETLYIFAETPGDEIQKFITDMGSIIRARFLNNRHRLYRAFLKCHITNREQMTLTILKTVHQYLQSFKLKTNSRAFTGGQD